MKKDEELENLIEGMYGNSVTTWLRKSEAHFAFTMLCDLTEGKINQSTAVTNLNNMPHNWQATAAFLILEHLQKKIGDKILVQVLNAFGEYRDWENAGKDPVSMQ